MQSVQDDIAQLRRDRSGSAKMEAIGHMAIVHNRVYVTPAMLDREKILYSPFVLHAGNSMYLPPGAILQITSAVAGSYILAPVRSPIWSGSGGPQALLDLMMHYIDFMRLSDRIRQCVDYQSLNGKAALRRQLPVQAVTSMLDLALPEAPAAYRRELDFPQAAQYSKELINLVRHVLPHYAKCVDSGMSTDELDMATIKHMRMKLKVRNVKRKKSIQK